MGRAFEDEGFCLVRGPDLIFGGDIRAFHPPAGKFDGIIGGVPCQSFSPLANLVRANGHEPRHGNLFPEYERVVREAEPAWFLCECVPAAPGPVVKGYATHSFVWGNHWLGEAQMRTRRFWFGVRGDEAVDLRRWLPQAALELPQAAATLVGGGGPPLGARLVGPDRRSDRQAVKEFAATASSGGRRRNGTRGNQGRSERCRLKPRSVRLADAIRLQGLPEDFLAEAPFTAQGKLQVVANGVPLPLGRALARAVQEALA